MDNLVEIRRTVGGEYRVMLQVGDPDEFMDKGTTREFFLVEKITMTISKKDADKIVSYDEVVGFDPETGEAIWEKRG